MKGGETNPFWQDRNFVRRAYVDQFVRGEEPIMSCCSLQRGQEKSGEIARTLPKVGCVLEVDSPAPYSQFKAKNHLSQGFQYLAYIFRFFKLCEKISHGSNEIHTT